VFNADSQPIIPADQPCAASMGGASVATMRDRMVAVVWMTRTAARGANQGMGRLFSASGGRKEGDGLIGLRRPRLGHKPPNAIACMAMLKTVCAAQKILADREIGA